MLDIVLDNQWNGNDINMKKKINAQFLIVVLIAIITTLVLATYVFYELFQKEVLEDLKTYAYVLKSTGNYEDIEGKQVLFNVKNIRLTIVDEDGTVLYDSDADTAVMDNHISRTEIIDALKNGEGSSVRRSATMDKNTFYYAVKLNNGMVLRIGKEAGSLWSVFFSVFPEIGCFIIVLFLFCLILAHYLTKSLMAPIEQMANHLDDIASIQGYKELRPFISMIQKQHEGIVKNAKMRQEFTANVSHELKTPLTSISGYSELIENGMASNKEAVIRFAREIQRNSNRLLILINDIIRLSQLDSSDFEITFEKVDIYNIAEECVNMLQMNAEKHGITIAIEGTHSDVIANKQMLEEVVFNLCDNAIRYNNEGGNIWISIKKEENQVTLEVKDNGIGISEKDQERIFERFYRVDKSRSKSTGGTGLGLAIVKHIVAQHDAKIELKSEVGKGTVIKIVFGVE